MPSLYPIWAQWGIVVQIAQIDTGCMSRVDTITQARTELLARVGLPAGADDEAVAQAHEQIVAFLDEAPDELHGWAQRRRAEANRVHDLLTGPETDLVPRRPRFPGWVRAVAGIIVVAAVVVGVYQLGRPAAPAVAPNPAPTPAGVAPTAPALDQARVDELNAKVAADPRDLDALFGLADAHYDARDFAAADGWLAKLLEVDPTHERGLIARGATLYQLDDPARAEAQWLRAAELYPTNPEIFYDLGFLYMTTGRTAEMQAAWDKVVALAPDSAWARTVQSHGGNG